MPTTVRIRDGDKERLDRLQDRIAVETGERLSLEELLHRLAKLGEAREDELLDGDGFSRLSEARKEEILSMGSHTGKTTREEDVDETLYGGPDGPA